MKRTLRATLLTVLLGLTVLTAGVIGAVGYLDSRYTATDLSRQILKETAERIEFQVDDLVRIARRQFLLNEHLLEMGFFDVDSDPRLLAFWEKVLESYHRISALYLTRDSDGYTLHVVKVPGQGIVYQSLVPVGKERFGLYRASRDEARRGDKGKLVREGTAEELDPRRMKWYKHARSADGAVWIDTDLDIDINQGPSFAGVTHARLLRDPKGRTYVLGLDFELRTLCSQLTDIRVKENGFPFIVERQSDGNRLVIAHPDPNVIIRTVSPGHDQVIPVNELSDARVRTFLEHMAPVLPAGEDALHTVLFEVDGVRYFGAYHGLRDKEGVAPRWYIAMLLPVADVLDRAEKNSRKSMAIGLVVILIAVVLSLYVAYQVSLPVERMARDAEAIGRLDLDAQTRQPSLIVEVDNLQRAMEDMKTSLRSFRKYVPADLVAHLMCSGKEAVLGGEHNELTISFSDIANFTTISEAMSPEKLVEHLGEYLQEMSEHVLTTGGTVDKYIGDAIMAFWGAPVELPGHALAACKAALLNQQLLEKLRQRWTSEGKPPFEARIGINTGEVIVGNIGSAKRMNYTVIGDAVNLASRLEGLNKYYGTRILISEATYEAAKHGIVARPLDWVSVKGKNTGVLVYELLGLQGETASDKVELAAAFGAGLQAYRRQEWSAALAKFAAILERWPEDAPTQEMRRRCEEYRQQPPPPDWDGVHHMHSK